MAPRPRPNSGLERHEEEVVGDSPLLDSYFHPFSNNTQEDDGGVDNLGKEEDEHEKISIIVGIVVALLLAVLIIIVSAIVFRRFRRRSSLPAASGDGKGMEMKRVKRGKGIDPEDDFASPLDDLQDPFMQFAYIPPNRGMKLWRGRFRILVRHLKRLLLKKEVAIHGCTIPDHCRQQLKTIYVY